MGKITDIPATVSDAGQDHNYTAPTAATVTIVSGNVTPQDRPLNATVADTFIAAQLAAGRGITRSVNMWDAGGPLDLERDLDLSRGFSYGKVVQPGVGARTTYFFITAAYLNRNVTRFEVVVDALATYNATLGHSHVVRGHVGVAASQNDVYGINYCLETEPIEVGPIDVEVSSTSSKLLNPATAGVAVLSTVDLNFTPVKGHFNPRAGHERPTFVPSAGAVGAIPYETGSPWTELPLINRPGDGSVPVPSPPQDWGSYDVDAIVQAQHPFSQSLSGVTGVPYQYIVPNLPNELISRIDGVPQAGRLYVFGSTAAFRGWLGVMRFFPWITAGIRAAWLTPPGYYGTTGSTTVLTQPTSFTAAVSAISSAIAIPVGIDDATSAGATTLSLANWRANITGYSKYRKLGTSQFSALQLSDRDTTIRLDPEMQRSANATASVRNSLSPAGGTYRARFTGTVQGDDYVQAVVGGVRTEVSVWGGGGIAAVAASLNSSLAANWDAAYQTENVIYHELYNRYAQTQTNVGAANRAYTQAMMSIITGGIL